MGVMRWLHVRFVRPIGPLQPLDRLLMSGWEVCVDKGKFTFLVDEEHFHWEDARVAEMDAVLARLEVRIVNRQAVGMVLRSERFDFGGSFHFNWQGQNAIAVGWGSDYPVLESAGERIGDASRGIGAVLQGLGNELVRNIADIEWTEHQ